MKKPLLEMLVCPVCLPDEIALKAVIEKSSPRTLPRAH